VRGLALIRIFGSALWLIGAASSATAEPINLSQALKYAMEHAPSMVQAREQIDVREAEVDRAKARYLPSLDLTTSQGYLRSGTQQVKSGTTPDGLGPVVMSTQAPWFSTLGLNLTETFYDNGQSYMQRDISEANREVSRLYMMDTRDSMLLRVSEAFYSLSQAEILLGTNVQQAQLTAKQLNKLEALYRQGLKTKREFFRLKSQAQRAAIEVSNAKVTRRNAEIELRRTMGVPVDATGITFVTLTTDDIQAHDPEVSTQVPTVDQSYLAKITEYQNTIGEDNIELARRRNLPVLTVGSGLNYQVPDYLRVQAGSGAPDAPNSWTWNVTVGVNYNIWDAGSRRRDIDIAASQKVIQNRDNRDKLFARAAEIAKLMETLRNLKSNLQLNKELMRLEQSNFAILEEDYRQGKVAYLDLVTGLSDLLSARVSYYTNYISILTAMAQYRYYEGTIYETVANS